VIRRGGGRTRYKGVSISDEAGRKKRQVSGVMKGLEDDVTEIGYGMSAGMLEASRAELDKSFQMSSRW
jgi:hypothetical protein